MWYKRGGTILRENNLKEIMDGVLNNEQEERLHYLRGWYRGSDRNKYWRHFGGGGGDSQWN